MLNNLRRLITRSIRPGKISATNCHDAPVVIDADPRTCGLKDAVRRGWYQTTGEIFIGFKVTPDDVVLDVGCGDGETTLFCARHGAHVVFSDVDAEKVKSLIEKARETRAKKVEGFVSNTMPLPLPDGYATKILAMEVLEHTQDPEKILDELVRVGRAGAQYLITVPDARSEMLQKPFADPIYFKAPNHIQIFDKDRFARLVESSGLKIERYDSSGFFWTVYMSMFWIISRDDRKNLSGLILDQIKPPYHPVLQSWANTWQQLMELKDSEKLLESFDAVLPKVQIIVARKI